jgi:hypothetical protein
MSVFLRIAASLPAGHDYALSQLFLADREKFSEDTVLHSRLDEAAVRSSRRAAIGPTVAAIRNTECADALAVHQGDARLKVQRALAANEHTPQQVCDWLLRLAVRRDDHEVIGNVAHRATPELVFEIAKAGSRPWSTVRKSDFALSIVENDALCAHALNAYDDGFAATLIATIQKARPDAVAHFASTLDPERAANVLAGAIAAVGFTTDELMEACVPHIRGVLEVIERRQLHARISATHLSMFLERADTVCPELVGTLFTRLSPDETSAHHFLRMLPESKVRVFERATFLMPLLDEKGIDVVTAFVLANSAHEAERLFAALPAHASEDARCAVLARFSGWRARNLLFKNTGTLSENEVKALLSNPETVKEVAVKLAFSPSEMASPHFDVITEALGPHLLSRVSVDQRAAQHVTKRLVETFADDGESIVLAARLIADGFVGSLGELVGVVRSMRC